MSRGIHYTAETGYTYDKNCNAVFSVIQLETVRKPSDLILTTDSSARRCNAWVLQSLGIGTASLRFHIMTHVET
jgi:hypothetical protein